MRSEARENSYEPEEFGVAPRTEAIREVGDEKIRIKRYESSSTQSSEAVFLPGWGTKAETYDLFAETLAKGDQSTKLKISPHTVTVIELGHGITPEAEIPEAPFQNATARKIASAEVALDQLFSEKPIDLVAHSEGGLVALGYALKHPERIRSLTLVNSAGLTGEEDSFFKLAGRYLRDAGGDSWIKILRKGDTKGTLQHMKQSIEEANAIAQTPDIVGVLKLLSEKGIDIRVLHAKRDRVFPADAVWKNLERELGIEGITVSFFSDPKARHNAPIINKRFGKAVGQILDQVDQRANISRAAR